MAEGPNLFARLHKWAKRQDENFLTESLAVVLEHLLILAPAVAVRLVARLTGGLIEVPPVGASGIVIQPQVEAEEGRPDLEISTTGQLVWVEVKAESRLRAGQLEGYRVMLESSEVASTRLVLLTRYPETYGETDVRPDLEVRWFEVADWLECELPALDEAGEVATFLARQFLGFLRRRGMTLTQVGKYMPEGLRALRSLIDMLFEAAATCRVSATTSAGRDYFGIKLDEGKYWAGVDLSAPEQLRFLTRARIDRERAVRLGVGEVAEASSSPGGYRWVRSVDLDTEEVHFYSRHKVGQMRWLEGFLRDCLAKARSIEAPDQPPLPDDTEGA